MNTGKAVSRVAIISILCGSLSIGAMAQPSPATVIDGATILIGNGRSIDKGVIQIRNGKISAVGARVPPAMFAETYYADGKFVTPGLIDVWTTLGAAGSGGGANSGAADAVNRYASDDIRAAIRHGVTAAYIPAEAGEGVGGVGAVVRFSTKPEGVSVLKERAALHMTVAAGQSSALQRLAAIQKFQSIWRTALDYREAQERYKEELEEYEKKIKERAEKAEKEKPKEEGKEKAGDKPEKKNGDKPKPDQPKPEDPKPKPEPKPEPKPGAESKWAPFGLDLRDAQRFDEEPTPEKKPDEPKSDGDKGDSEKKKDDIKKPEPPPRNPEAEALLEVLDGKIRLRVHAERPAEILAVVETAQRYNLPVVLEGASGARFVAKALKKLEAPVVFGVDPQSMFESSGSMRYHQPNGMPSARAAGIDAYLGSGLSEVTPQLAVRAAAAVAAGLPERDALPLITSKAATLLGVDEEIGMIEGGHSADLVVWSAHPFAPGAKVERVYVAGELVYDIEDAE